MGFSVSAFRNLLSRLSDPLPLKTLVLTTTISTFGIAGLQAQCGPGACKGPNLVVNGNFEQDIIDPNNPIQGFTTDFGVVACPPVQTSDLWGSITVQVDPNLCYFEWVSNDHTMDDGSGKMLVADFPDFNPDGTTNSMSIWRSDVKVEPGKTYCFGAWFMNLNSNTTKSKPNFEYYANGNLIGVSPDLPESGQWEYYAFTYTVPANDSILVISLNNGKFGGEGNDLAIDDIEFAELVSGVQPPVAVNDEAVMLPSAVDYPINVLYNDYSLSHGEALINSSLRLLTQPPVSVGTASVDTNTWEILFTPAPGFNGSHTFLYEVCQTGGCCDQAIIKVTVDNILPVEMEDLRAEMFGGHGLLRWVTKNEVNNSHFEVQRSTDNVIFQTVGEVVGSGTTARANSYSFRDTEVSNLQQQTIYYRLKQVDLNGSFSWSGSVELNVVSSNTARLHAYPNPSRGDQSIHIDFTNETGDQMELRVINMTGQTLYQKAIQATEVSNGIDLPANQLPKGIYMVSMANEYFATSQRIIITD